MVLFNFKPTSLLNTAWARIINFVILLFLAVILSATRLHISCDIEGGYILFTAFWGIFSVGSSVEYVLKKNMWFELDSKESKNKESFILFYFILAFIFVELIAICLSSAIMVYEKGGFVFWLYVLMTIYFAFNWINICSLFNFNDGFAKLLPQYIDTSKLPTKEALKKDREILKYVLEKEYKIDLERLMDSVSENGWHNFLNRGW